jgi:hypothetical protein
MREQIIIMEIEINIEKKHAYGLFVLLLLVYFSLQITPTAALDPTKGWHPAEQISGGTIQGTLSVTGDFIVGSGGSANLSVCCIEGKNLADDLLGKLLVQYGTGMEVYIGSFFNRYGSSLSVYGNVGVDKSPAADAALDVAGDISAANITVTGKVSGMIPYSNSYQACDTSRIALGKHERVMCYLTGLTGGMSGGGSAHVFVNSLDQTWYLERGHANANQCIKAMCAGIV